MAPTVAYAHSPTRSIGAANGVDYTYRECGEGDLPLVLLQHFRGNLDNWDPALVDALAVDRRVIAFNNAGVGSSSGNTPSTAAHMARDAIALFDALQLEQADILGFSLGSFVAQEIALIRPDAVRRMVLASSAPQGAPGMHGWARKVVDAVGAPGADPDGYLNVFYTPSPESRTAGQASLGRIFGRPSEPDKATDWRTRLAQYDAVCAWGIPNHGSLQRLAGIEAPVFVANGDSDPMILPRYSYLLAGLLPDARVTIYPDAAHGFLFQHHAQFAGDVSDFLNEVR